MSLCASGSSTTVAVQRCVTRAASAQKRGILHAKKRQHEEPPEVAIQRMLQKPYYVAAQRAFLSNCLTACLSALLILLV